MRTLRRSLALVFSVSLLTGPAAGCITVEVPQQPDGDVVRMETERQDQDMDGLCDDTEFLNGTDPFNPDTDGDGFEDAQEFALGTNPLSRQSPSEGELLVLSSEKNSTATLELKTEVGGVGQDFTGFLVLPEGEDDRAIRVADYFQSAQAAYAVPPDQVAVVESESQTFRGVVGQTELVTLLTFGSGDREPVACATARRFGYGFKDGEEPFAGESQALFVLLPPDDTLAEGTTFCGSPNAGCQ